jgi:hypothetical protein
VVSHREVTNAGTDLPNDTRPFVSTYQGKTHPEHVAGADVMIGMTETGGRELDEQFAFLRRVEFDLFHRPLLVQSPQNCTLGLHSDSSTICIARSGQFAIALCARSSHSEGRFSMVTKAIPSSSMPNNSGNVA